MSERRTIAYQPALDGVRAVAVVAVLLFHAEVAGFDGGYLGVSVFFTLSGYLITTLLVGEHDATGRVALGDFYRRRVRRLLPASASCLALVVIIGAVSDVFDGVADLRNHVIGSVLQVANWVFLAGSGSYQQLFQQAGGAVSPLEHFWSLAIEEQFYWIWPPTMVVILGRCRTVRSRTISVGLVTAVFCVSAPIIGLVWGPDAVYWATPARIGEILVGALLAIVLAGRSVDERYARLAPISLTGLLVCVVTFPQSSGPAYHGALPLVALGSAGLVLGLQTQSPLRSALSAPPLVWLGKISYGVYVFHWPIYVILDEQRTGLDPVSLLVVRLVLTLALAEASYRLIELPVRHNTGAASPNTFRVAVFASVSVVVLAVAVVPSGVGDYWMTDAAVAEAVAITANRAPLRVVTSARNVTPAATPDGASDPTASPLPAKPTEATPTPTITPSITPTTPTTPITSQITPTTPTMSAPIVLTRPVRIVVAGDSTAIATGTGLVAWAAAHPGLAQVEIVAQRGCGFVRGGERQVDDFESIPNYCDRWIDEQLPAQVEALQPDVVMLMVTSWDVLDRRWESGVVESPMDLDYAARISHDYAALADALLARGARSIAFVRAPVPNIWWRGTREGQEDPARHDVVYAAMSDVQAGSNATIGVIGLDQWLIAEGLDQDHAVRPDGVHWDQSAARMVAEYFLGDQLLRIALR